MSLAVGGEGRWGWGRVEENCVSWRSMVRVTSASRSYYAIESASLISCSLTLARTYKLQHVAHELVEQRLTLVVIAPVEHAAN